MSSLGEFSSHMAHEINNPLAIISGSADKLIRMFVADEVNVDNALSNIRKIKDTVFRISKIIQGLKSFSRNEENDLKKQVDLCNLIEEVMVLGSDRLLMENINLKYEFLNRPMFNCRPTEIQQVIINLVNNSIDAISGKQNPWIVIRCEVDKDEIKLTIIDSGKGIQPDIQKKLMIPFFTTKEAGKGTGLGLSISKGLIENNDGQLDYIQGSPNTSFRLLFKIK
jgi:C4-dicarboxylate-specific signal transduction histidine kinase